MTSEATLYDDARVDAAITTSSDDAISSEPFWDQAFTNAIRKTRSISTLACNDAPNLREVGALLYNDTALEALVDAGAARTRGAERENDSRLNRIWLEKDWAEMDHGLRARLIEGIQRAGQSKLTVSDMTGGTGAPTVGERRGPWFQDEEAPLEHLATAPAHPRRHRTDHRRAAPEKGDGAWHDHRDDRPRRLRGSRAAGHHAGGELQAEGEDRRLARERTNANQEPGLPETPAQHQAQAQALNTQKTALNRTTMRFDLTEPCTQCPFRRASCPGWTGPWTPTELLEAIRERPFPCHPTISHDDQPVEDDTLQSCAGAAIFLNNSGEPCYTGWTHHHQELLREAAEQTRTASSTRSCSCWRTTSRHADSAPHTGGSPRIPVEAGGPTPRPHGSPRVPC